MLGSFDGSDHDVERASTARSRARDRREPRHAHQVPPPPGRRPPRRGAARQRDVSPLDELAEAIELPERAFVLGVQWHPEADAASPVIGALVAAAERARARPTGRLLAHRALAPRATRRVRAEAAHILGRVRRSTALRATAWGVVAAGSPRRSLRKRVPAPPVVAAGGRLRRAARPVRRDAPLAHARRRRLRAADVGLRRRVQDAARRPGRAGAARALRLPDRRRPRARPRRAADACACSARSPAIGPDGAGMARAGPRARVGALGVVRGAARHRRLHPRCATPSASRARPC